MTSVRIQGAYSAATDLNPATGEPWPYALPQGDETLLTDSVTDIVGELIDGYADLPDTEEGRDEALIQRTMQTILLAAQAQAMIAADAAHDGRLDTDDEDLLTALFADRAVPLYGLDEWNHDIPLVLNAIDYAPFTAEPAPEGNILWIDPSDETMFVMSLKHLGMLPLYVHEDA